MTWAAAVTAVEIALMAALLRGARTGSARARTALLCLASALTIAYLTWRLSSTLVFSSFWGVPSLLLVVAELVGFFQMCTYYLLSARPYRRPRPATPPGESLPTVDLFVPTFNEPARVLRRTLAGCSQISYPAEKLTVWVLDDGDRPAVREMAAAFGLRYIARQERRHAKAGNMNNALAQSSGELVGILDADMIPKAGMVMDMVGYFAHDPRLAFVQAPQTFFNPDPFQHNLGLHRLIPNEQDFFMRDILAIRDRVNGVMCVGSNVLFRRTALESIGGFGTRSITEDMETGLTLHAAGWRSAYHDGEVAVGLAPESMAEMVAQRVRWCRGNIQAARAYNPVTLPGLTLWQRAVYTTGVVYWYLGLQRAVFLLAPLLYLLLGVQSLRATPAGLLVFWLPATVCAGLASSLGTEYAAVFWSSVSELALTPALAGAALREILQIRGKGFRVTRKGLTTQRAGVAGQSFTYLGILLGLEVAAVAVGMVKLLSPLGPDETVAVVVNLFWAVGNTVLTVFAVLSCVDHARPRNAERFPVRVRASLAIGDRRVSGHTADISETGARIAVSGAAWPSWISPGTACSVVLPDADLEVPAVVTSWGDADGGTELAVAFEPVADSDFPRLVRLLFDRPNVSGHGGYRIGVIGAMHRVVRWEVRQGVGLGVAPRRHLPVRLRRHPAPEA